MMRFICYKGLEQSKFIESPLKKPVINLGVCPKSLDSCNYDIDCTKHGLDYKHCALSKAMKFGVCTKNLYN